MSCSKTLKNGELLELIAWGRAGLLRAGIEEGQEECERILMKLLGCLRSGIYLEEHELIKSGIRERFLAILEKRLQRIPLAYLLREADFWQETLYVDERCLIPRPETEILVEVVIKALKDLGRDRSLRAGGEAIPFLKTDRHAPVGLAMTNREQTLSFLDIGTGSGAIAVALLREFPGAHGTLLDISREALEVARMNIEKYGLHDRAILVQGNIFSEWYPHPGPLPEGEGRVKGSKLFDLIVSNPPYLSEKDWEGVQEELKFEPRKALDGGKDGLDFYRKIIKEARHHLRPGGLLAFEVGAGQAGPPIGPARSRGLDAPSSQADMVSTWLQTAGYVNIQRFKDHLGIERVVIARYPS